MREAVVLYGIVCFLLGVAAAWAPAAGRSLAAWVLRNRDGR